MTVSACSRALRSEMRGLRRRASAVCAAASARRNMTSGSARQALEAVRTEVMQSEVVRATAQADLTHLAAACLESLNLAIVDVVAEVERMEREGELAAPAAGSPRHRLLTRMKTTLTRWTHRKSPQTAVAPDATDVAPALLSPDDVIANLRQKIDKLGPVNMMAIEQFDELENRHTFLTTQRKDLLDSIAQTSEAIKKIDVTTRVRFEEAFATINTYFEGTFTTLFGGGRAGLVLIDQENQIESGIDIIAQPPGKRLQNVQLLSGGEKALDRHGADVRRLQVPAQPVLSARRNRRAAR